MPSANAAVAWGLVELLLTLPSTYCCAGLPLAASVLLRSNACHSRLLKASKVQKLRIDFVSNTLWNLRLGPVIMSVRFHTLRHGLRPGYSSIGKSAATGHAFFTKASITSATMVLAGLSLRLRSE